MGLDSFLHNQCMEAIRQLANKYPNDMDLGKNIRSFIQDSNHEAINQLALDFNKLNESEESDT